MTDEHGLDDRSLQIVKAIVDEYMQSGNPVGSATLSEKGGIELSPASVRSVMAELERQGFIEHVHVSSGRRPTAKGMRVYLGSLVRMSDPTESDRRELEGGLRTDSTNGMAKSALQSVAALTKMISLVSIPGTTEARLKQVHFVELSSTRLMAVLVSADGEVRNRLIEVDGPFGPGELEGAAALFNERFAGHTLSSAKVELRGLVGGLKGRIADLMSRMLAAITDGGGDGRKVYVHGPENLPADGEIVRDADRLQDMVRLLRRKEVLLGVLDKGLAAEDVSVFIGSESGVPELEDFSLVASPYVDGNGETVGVLGVIGPIRMRYGRIVPIIELTSDLMSAAAAKIHRDYS